MNSFSLPPRFHDLLQDFVVNVIQDKPEDIVDYAAHYFTDLNSCALKGNYVSNPMPNLTHQDDSGDEEFLPPPPRPGRERRRAVAGESYDPSQEMDDGPIISHPKTDWQLQSLKAAVKDILLFKCCDEEQLTVVLNAMFERKVSKSDIVIKQGDDGDNFYVIQEGKFDVLIENGKEEKRVATLDGKGSFGELALLYNCPRMATIVAQSIGVLWCLDQSTFRKIIVGAAAKKRKKFESLLESVPMLSDLTPYERMNLADALDTIVFQDGKCIIKEGDSAVNMYFIMKGTVSITVREKDSDNEREVAKAESGQYFGELALVMKQPRVASVYAVGSVVCAVLDVAAFERLLGPCVNIMKRNIKVYESERKRLGITSIQ